MKLDQWAPRKPGRKDAPAIKTSVTILESRRLRHLAKGDRVAEIGTAFGYSAIVMALGGAKEVVTADPHKDLDSWGEVTRHVKAWGVEEVVRVGVGTGIDVLIPLASEQVFDGCFIDGDHSKEAVLRDAHLARLIVKPHGWLAFHDYNEDTCPGVKEALDEIWPDGPDELTHTLYVRRTL